MTVLITAGGSFMAACSDGARSTVFALPMNSTSTQFLTSLSVTGGYRSDGVDKNGFPAYSGFADATIFNFNYSGASSVKWADGGGEGLKVPNPFQQSFGAYFGRPFTHAISVEDATPGHGGDGFTVDITVALLTGTWATPSGVPETYTFIQHGTTFEGAGLINGVKHKGVGNGVIGPAIDITFTRTDPDAAFDPIDGTMQLTAGPFNDQFPGDLKGVFTHRDGSTEPYELQICGTPISPRSCPP